MKSKKKQKSLRNKNALGGKWMYLSDREQIIRDSFTGMPKYKVIEKWRPMYPPGWIKGVLEGVDTSRDEYNALLGHYSPGTPEYEALKHHLDNLPLGAMITCRKTPFVSEATLAYERRHNHDFDNGTIEAIIRIRGGVWL